MKIIYNIIGVLDETATSPAPNSPSDLIPSYLEPMYRRQAAVRSLRPYLSLAIVRGALLRTAICDSEESVRKVAILELFRARSDGFRVALVAAAVDRDDSIRQLSLECLNFLAAVEKSEVATFLLNDPDPDIVQLASDILAERPISYYHLEQI